MTTPALNNLLPPGLISNLQQVLSNRKPEAGREDDGLTPKPDNGDDVSASSSSPEAEPDGEKDSRPIILVTGSDGLESPGLSSLVDALVREGAYNVHVVAPQSNKSTSGHSVSLKETVEVVSAEYVGAIAYEVSGTPVDCVSLALSGALFSWAKPLLVISGINKGSSCGYHMFYSSVFAGAREALMNGVSSIAISLDWKKDGSRETDFKDTAIVCLPIINAAIQDIEKGTFPKGFALAIEVPASPLTNKGIKITKRSCWRSSLSWQAISGTRNLAAARFGGGQPGIDMQFAQLGRDASAAGAARRLATQKKNIEVVESVGAIGKSDFKKMTKYFRAEMVDKEHDEDDEDLDFRALENGFVGVTPFSTSVHLDLETETAASIWISTILSTDN